MPSDNTALSARAKITSHLRNGNIMASLSRLYSYFLDRCMISKCYAGCTCVGDKFTCCHGGLSKQIGPHLQKKAALLHGHMGLQCMGFSPSQGPLWTLQQPWPYWSTDPLQSGSAQAVSCHFLANACSIPLKWAR